MEQCVHKDYIYINFYFQGKIWVSTDAGSTTSIESTMTDDMRRAKYDRDISLDR